MSQKQKFLGREIKRDTGPNSLMTTRVDFQIFDPQLLFHAAGERRKAERTRASNSENANGLTK